MTNRKKRAAGKLPNGTEPYMGMRPNGFNMKPIDRAKEKNAVKNQYLHAPRDPLTVERAQEIKDKADTGLAINEAKANPDPPMDDD